jgi:prepilin-type N-terminal cleavage/methylation domain-containing protein
MAVRRYDQRGFTIIEVMAAVFIIAVSFLGLASVHVTSSKAHSLGMNRSTAAMLATQDIELMRRSTLANINGGNSSANVGGVPYAITRTVANLSQGKKVTIAVAWTDRFGPQTFTTQTVVSQVTNP